MLDPDIQRLLDTVFAVPPGADAPDLAQLRRAAEDAPIRLGGNPEPVATIDDALVRGAETSLPVRVYRPAAKDALPLVVYGHGGGWVTGSLDSHDRLCRVLANRLRAVVVVVDYRRAPEHVYPAALDDFEAAWRWARAEAATLGADGTRFVVAGDSSGGNLAAALTLRLRSDGASQPNLQMLLYPALDASCSRPSYREFATGYSLSAVQMAWYWDTYRAGAAKNAVGLSPLAAVDLSGLPPAVIAVAESDVLRDDALDYAARLKASGVQVELIVCTGMIHGFLRWTGEVAAASGWLDAVAAAARRVLGAPA